MRVLWIVSDVITKFIPFVSGKHSVGGSWITQLLFLLAKFRILQAYLCGAMGIMCIIIGYMPLTRLTCPKCNRDFLVVNGTIITSIPVLIDAAITGHLECRKCGTKVF